jgi:HTH-type transcriptional regulator, sugar sensing transcriptional regulator
MLFILIMDLDILKDLGLTPNEIKMYLTLLELSCASAGDILKKSKLPNSTVHRTLNSLIEKGLVNFILEGKRKIYQATDPEHFFNFIDDKKKRFEEILPLLKKKQKFVKKQELASVYKGIRGVKEVYNIMINAKGREYNTFGGGPVAAEIMGFTWWLNLHKRRVANKLASRQIFDDSVKWGGKDIEKNPLTKIKYVDKEFAQFQETVIVGDYVAIAVFSENPYAFLIKDKLVADSYRKHFNLLWRMTKN